MTLILVVILDKSGARLRVSLVVVVLLGRGFTLGKLYRDLGPLGNLAPLAQLASCATC